MPLSFGTAGLTWRGSFLFMESELWICEVCKKHIPEGCARITKAKAKARFVALFKMQCDKFCTSCYSKLAAMSRKKPVGGCFAGVEQSVASLEAGFMPADTMDRIVEIESLIEETETNIKVHLARVERENRSLNMLKRFNTDLSRAIGDYLWRSYPERRKRADAIISKLELRFMVFSRDGWKCVQCSNNQRLSVDHIVPVAKNGSDDLANLQTLCRSCNSKKGTSIK